MIQTTKKTKLIISGALMTVAVIVLALNFWVNFSFTGHHKGIYLLHGENKPLVVTDDLFLGQEGEVVGRIDFDWFQGLQSAQGYQNRPHLTVEWDEKDGQGYIRNYLGGGKILMTSFSRYIDNEGQNPRGLFIGGALPEALRDANTNNSGMSYFDGEQWSHIWCNTNEGIGSTISSRGYPPSDWRFIDSRIVSQTEDHVLLISHHEIDVDGVLLQMERTVEMTAGDPDLNLTVRIVNSGNGVARYFYYYGDEPWLGDFGSSAGDVGWVEGRTIEYEENLDPKKIDFAGMGDFGSSLLGERHNYRKVANFIEWLGPDRPDQVFIANQPNGMDHDPRILSPLQGDSRSIGMYWGPRILTSGQTQLFSLAIGMADHNPLTGQPELPAHLSAVNRKLAGASHKL